MSSQMRRLKLRKIEFLGSSAQLAGRHHDSPLTSPPRAGETRLAALCVFRAGQAPAGPAPPRRRTDRAEGEIALLV